MEWRLGRFTVYSSPHVCVAFQHKFPISVVIFSLDTGLPQSTQTHTCPNLIVGGKLLTGCDTQLHGLHSHLLRHVCVLHREHKTIYGFSTDGVGTIPTYDHRPQMLLNMKLQLP